MSIGLFSYCDRDLLFDQASVGDVQANQAPDRVTCNKHPCCSHLTGAIRGCNAHRQGPGSRKNENGSQKIDDLESKEPIAQPDALPTKLEKPDTRKEKDHKEYKIDGGSHYECF